MAFVFQTERKINEPNKMGCPLGPGHYSPAARVTHVHDSAPFQSSSLRKTIFQTKGLQKPGPGDYQVSRPIVEPNIKSVSNHHSIILKINSIGTAQFKSAKDRFIDLSNDVPGPGQYECKVSRKSDRQRRRVNSSATGETETDKKLKQLNKSLQQKHYPAIPEKIRGLTDNKNEEVVPEEAKLGPACYNPCQTVHVNSTSTVWGKDKTKRFVSERKIPIGPGQYKIDYNPSRPEDKANLSNSYFRSATVRTYFDTLLYKTNLENVANERVKNAYKSKEPAPGQYEANPSSFIPKEKPFSFQFFGSTVERFPEEQILNDESKKNEFYNIKSGIGNNRSFNRGTQAFNSEQSREPSFLQLKEKANLPGPGDYKEKVVVEKKLRGLKVEKFGSTTGRELELPEEKDPVGPGKYSPMQSSNDEFYKTRFGQIKQESFHFKSNTARECFGATKTGTQIGQYQVSYNDVSKKLQRQRLFIQNLKKIDVEKAPFESSNARFPHYEQQSEVPKENESRANLNKEHEQRLKQQNERVRSEIIAMNRSQANERILNGLFDKQNRFSQEKRGVPGVGAYTMREEWRRKSHNIKFKK